MQVSLPAFVIATDLQPGEPSWPAAEAQVVQIREESARILGFEPQVTLAAPPWCTLPGAHEIFVLPAALEFSLLQREALGRALTEARRATLRSPSTTTTSTLGTRWWLRHCVDGQRQLELRRHRRQRAGR